MAGVYPAGSYIAIGGEPGNTTGPFASGPSLADVQMVFADSGLAVYDIGYSGFFSKYFWINAVTETPLTEDNVRSIFAYYAALLFNANMRSIDPPTPPAQITYAGGSGGGGNAGGGGGAGGSGGGGGIIPGGGAPKPPTTSNTSSLIVLGAVLFAVVLLPGLSGGGSTRRRRR